MTIQNLESKELSHFRINEKKDKDNVIDFHLVRHDGNLPNDIEKKLVSSIDKLEKQQGGKKIHKKSKDDTEDDSSSDSDSSEENDYYLKFPILPINRFVYYYLPYHKFKVVGMNPLEVSKLYVPMFSFPINPSNCLTDQKTVYS